MSAPSPEELAAATLARQGLDRRTGRRGVDATLRRLVALQAQMPGSVPLGLAVRHDGVDAALVTRRLEAEKRWLRTWCLRSTMHVVAVEDFPLIRAAVMDDWYQSWCSMRRRKDGLSMKEIERWNGRILEVLEDGPCTRKELEAAGIQLQYWSREIKGLCFTGEVVTVGKRGSQSVLDLTERWLGRPLRPRPPRDEALGELLVRYLEGYGPATPQDYAHWLGVRVRDAKRAVEVAGDRAVPRGGGYLDVEGAPSGSRSLPPRLLPRFDVSLLAHRDKTRFMTEAERKKVFLPSAVVEPAALVEGRVAGTWKYAGKMELAPFGRLPKGARSALRAEHERLAPLL